MLVRVCVCDAFNTDNKKNKFQSSGSVQQRTSVGCVFISYKILKLLLPVCAAGKTRCLGCRDRGCAWDSCMLELVTSVTSAASLLRTVVGSELVSIQLLGSLQVTCLSSGPVNISEAQTVRRWLVAAMN